MQKQRERIRLAQSGEKEERDRFVEENMGLVCHVARRFLNRGYDLEELIQVGCIGLIKAVQKFDVRYEVCFSTYAVCLIQGEIRRFIRDGGLVKVGRTVKENGARIMRGREKLLQKSGREPTIRELREETGLTEEEILLAMEANAEVDSIDRENFNTAFCKTAAQQDKVLDHVMLSQILNGLSGRDRHLILLRYQEGLTQAETGKRLQMSQVQISRQEKKILTLLRKKLE
ncbi:MAG: sigma-70 family RNA polymerase sigma factor [Lachnospiraceae bacterium]|nr:sigma-70 family RNA polymerase sigma factor [Lachnospiraceae bacterium]